jgi:HEAT repeat protein
VDRKLKELVEQLKDPDTGTDAAEMLGEIGDASAVPALIETLKNEGTVRRCSAARALGKIGDQSAAPALIGALEDGDINVRNRAVIALGKIDIGDGHFETIVKLQKHGNNRAKEWVARALGEITHPSAVPVLIKALENHDREVQIAAAEKLGEKKDASAVPALIEKLKYTTGKLAEAAAEALVNIGGDSVVSALIDFLKKIDNDPDRCRAINILGKLGYESAVPAFINALKDDRWRVRNSSALALIKIGEPAVPALFEALKDENLYVQEGVAWVLGKIGEVALEAFNKAYLKGDIRHELAEIFYKSLRKKIETYEFDKGCVAPPKKKPDDLKRMMIRRREKPNEKKIERRITA